MKTKIHYLTDHQPIINQLIEKYNGLDFVSIKTKSMEGVSILLIIEPFKVNDRYIAVSEVWRNYLKVKAAEVKLIVAGFIAYEHPNYIDLMALPNDLEVFVQAAANIQEEYLFPWDSNPKERYKWAVGMDMVDKLRQLFKGHGKQSIAAQLSKIRATIDILDEVAREGIEERWQAVLEEFWEMGVKEMQYFCDRWYNYYDFFKYLPFYKQAEEINQMVKKISPFFQYSKPPTAIAFLNHKCLNKIELIKNHLNEIKKYVPEKAPIPNLID